MIKKKSDPFTVEEFIQAQIPVVQKIIQDEIGVETRRRGMPVSPNDPAVRQRICQVISENETKLISEIKQKLLERKS